MRCLVPPAALIPVSRTDALFVKPPIACSARDGMERSGVPATLPPPPDVAVKGRRALYGECAASRAAKSLGVRGSVGGVDIVKEGVTDCAAIVVAL